MCSKHALALYLIFDNVLVGSIVNTIERACGIILKTQEQEIFGLNPCKLLHLYHDYETWNENFHHLQLLTMCRSMGMFEEFEVPKIRPHIVVELKLTWYCGVDLFCCLCKPRQHIMLISHGIEKIYAQGLAILIITWHVAWDSYSGSVYFETFQRHCFGLLYGTTISYSFPNFFLLTMR